MASKGSGCTPKPVDLLKPRSHLVPTGWRQGRPSLGRSILDGCCGVPMGRAGFRIVEGGRYYSLVCPRAQVIQHQVAMPAVVGGQVVNINDRAAARWPSVDFPASRANGTKAGRPSRAPSRACAGRNLLYCPDDDPQLDSRRAHHRLAVPDRPGLRSDALTITATHSFFQKAALQGDAEHPAGDRAVLRVEELLRRRPGVAVQRDRAVHQDGAAGRDFLGEESRRRNTGSICSPAR